MQKICHVGNRMQRLYVEKRLVDWKRKYSDIRTGYAKQVLRFSFFFLVLRFLGGMMNSGVMKVKES